MDRGMDIIVFIRPSLRLGLYIWKKKKMYALYVWEWFHWRCSPDKCITAASKGAGTQLRSRQLIKEEVSLNKLPCKQTFCQQKGRPSREATSFLFHLLSRWKELSWDSFIRWNAGHKCNVSVKRHLCIMGQTEAFRVSWASHTSC